MVWLDCENLIVLRGSGAVAPFASASMLPALWLASRLGVSDVLSASLGEAVRYFSIEFKHFIFVLWINYSP